MNDFTVNFEFSIEIDFVQCHFSLFCELEEPCYFFDEMRRQQTLFIIMHPIVLKNERRARISIAIIGSLFDDAMAGEKSSIYHVFQSVTA